MNKLLVVGFAAALACAFALPAFAQTHSAKKEVATAHAHALMAEHAKTVKMAHTHLHHVINCLVGTHGKEFDAAAGDPCKGQGNGALSDSASDHALHGKLKDALSAAQAGLKSDSLAKVHKDAAKAAAALQATPTQKSSGGYSW
ncbi:MAG: hypothetical protein ACRESR_09345 [Gammaproteobacteria bacterium]